MATGRLAFEGDDALATMLAVTTHEPAPPGEINPDLPAEVEELILALLAKAPEDRPPTARAVLERVRKIEDCLG
jgi:serine/threonine-protein kinase